MGATHFDRPGDRTFITGKVVVKSGVGYMDAPGPAVARIGVQGEDEAGPMKTRTYLNRAETENAITELTKLLYKGQAASEEDGHMAEHYIEAYTLCRIRGDAALMARAVLGGKAALGQIADEVAADFRATMVRLGRLFEANERV